MKHRIPALATAVACLLAMTVGTALAVIPGTLDQAQTVYSTGLGQQTQLAQTFTAGLSGQLDAVEVYTSLVSSPTGVAKPNVDSITVQITGTDGSGLPTSTILAAETGTPADSDWETFEFSSPATVAAGTKYAILVQGTGFEWNGACNDNYGPGTALILDTTWKTIAAWNGNYCLADFAFQTFVDQSKTPPPTSTAAASPVDRPDNSGLMLVFAGLTGAAAVALFSAITRRRITRR